MDNVKFDYEKIDILCVHSNDEYIAGDFFDNFEYYQYLKKYTNYQVKFLVVSNFPQDLLYKAIFEKYDKDRISFDGIEFISRKYIHKLFIGRIFKYSPKVIFSTSSYSTFKLFTILNQKNIIYSYNKIITINNGSYEMVKNPYDRLSNYCRNNVILLGDDRTKWYYDDLWDEKYRIKINFEIFNNCNFTGNGIFINLYTDHKNYEIDEIIQYVKKNNVKKVLLCVHKNSINRYSNIKIEGVDVEISTTPIKDLMNRFDTYVYFPTKRKWDVSPRLIPESKWYGKKVDYVDHGKIKDGSYYRYIDTVDNFDSLILKKNDEIIDILGRYI